MSTQGYISTADPFLQGVGAGRGGAPPFVPTDIAGLVGWWDASDKDDAGKVTLNGSKITTLIDQSTTGANMTQGTDSKRPTASVASHNGLDSAVFDRASAQIMGTGAVTAYDSWNDLWIFSVHRYTGTPVAASEFLFSFVNNSTFHTIGQWTWNSPSNVQKAYVGTSATPHDVSIPHSNAWGQFTHYYAPVTAVSNLDGVQTDTKTPITTTPTTHVDFAIGGTAGDAVHGNVEFAEIVVYQDTLLTVGEVSQVESYLQGRHGTP